MRPRHCTHLFETIAIVCKSPLTLSHLDIIGGFGYLRDIEIFRELKELLQATRTLRRLDLEGFRALDEEELEYVFDGLLSSRYVTRLSLRSCEFDPGADTVLTRYMQTPRTSEQALSSLDLKETYVANASMLISTPSSLNTTAIPTIGSSLQALRLDTHDDDDIFPF
jgi:hypothetical protein